MSILEDPEEMRRSGYRVVDAIVERLSELRDDKAFQTAPREVTEALLDGPPPEEGRDLDPLLETVVGDVMPLAARIDHPRFLAFVPASPSWASVLASFLISGYNVFQGTWLASAGPSQIELTVTDWFRDWLGYPEGAGGLFTSGGSAANLLAVVAAREAAGNPRRGVVYVSDQAHGSVGRAARIAGVDPARIRVLATDDEFRIVPATLLEAVRRDCEAGLEPFCLVANAGTTNTGAIDPLVELAEIARAEGLWNHIDAAYGGFAVLDPETRPLLHGLELADSVTLDPHKWLMQPFETGCLMARDVTRLESAFRILPDYMQDTDLGSQQGELLQPRAPAHPRVSRAARMAVDPALRPGCAPASHRRGDPHRRERSGTGSQARTNWNSSRRRVLAWSAFATGALPQSRPLPMNASTS